jgi:hypothetical protein
MEGGGGTNLHLINKAILIKYCVTLSQAANTCVKFVQTHPHFHLHPGLHPTLMCISLLMQLLRTV